MNPIAARAHFWKASLLAGLLLALSPALAVAQVVPGGGDIQAPAPPAPFAMGVHYEVREDVTCHPGGGSDPQCSDTSAKGFGTRIADATLIGENWGAPEFSGLVHTEASSIVSKVDWTGPAHGKMMVESPSGQVRSVFSGQLNLALAVLADPPVPIAPITGNWHGTKGFGAGGDFNGLFLLPFQIPGQPELGWFYLDQTPEGKGRLCGSPNGVCPLRPGEFRPDAPRQGGEFLNGVPLVKLVVTYFKK